MNFSLIKWAQWTHEELAEISAFTNKKKVLTSNMKFFSYQLNL